MECQKCQIPLDNDTKCSCNENICYHCCECDADCGCGCGNK